MADQAITSLPIKTASGIASTDYMLGIDSAEGYQMLIQDLGNYIITHSTASLAGSSQTLKAAIDGLNSKIRHNNVSTTSYTFTGATRSSVADYSHFMFYGGTGRSDTSQFLYIGFVDLQANDNVVLICPVKAHASITFNGTYSNNTLTITTSSTLWGGMTLIWDN